MQGRRDHVLMLDARSIYRKVSRSVCDFSSEQQKNIAAIVWLYRGEQDRFLNLVESYLAHAISEGEATTASVDVLAGALGKLIELIEPFVTMKCKDDTLAELWDELTGVKATLTADDEAFTAEVAAGAAGWPGVARGDARRTNARRSLNFGSHFCSHSYRFCPR